MTDSAMRIDPVSSARHPTATTISRSHWQSHPAVTLNQPGDVGPFDAAL